MQVNTRDIIFLIMILCCSEVRSLDISDVHHMHQESSAEEMSEIEDLTKETPNQETSEPEELSQGSLSQHIYEPEELPQETPSQETSEPEELPQETSSQETSEPKELPQETASQETSEPEELPQETSSQETSEPEDPPQETASQEKSEPEELPQEIASQEMCELEELHQETSIQETSEPEDPPQETASQEMCELEELHQETSSKEMCEIEELPQESSAEGSFLEVNKTNSLQKKWSIAVAVGGSARGKIKGLGHDLNHESKVFVRAEANRAMSDSYSLGLAILHQDQGVSKGNYMAGMVPAKASLSYSTTAILVNTKYFYTNTLFGFTPYITASIGASLNKSTNEYHSAQNLSASHKGSNISVQPAFGIGIGGYYNISDSIRWILEYQYMNLGKVKSDTVIDALGQSRKETRSRKLQKNMFMIGLDFKM